MEIKSAKHGQVAMRVPMLVSQNCVSGLLLGFNVIEEIILESLKNPGSVSLSDLLAEALKLHRDTAETIVSVISGTPAQETPRTDTIREVSQFQLARYVKSSVVAGRGKRGEQCYSNLP